MKKIAVMCALALAVGLMASTALASPSGDKATGGVGFITIFDKPAEASFTAHDTPTGAKGQVNASGLTPSGDVWYTGTVDCYKALGDNSARFSGTVDDTNDPREPGYFVFVVEDNGSPGWLPPADRIAQNLRRNPVDCVTDSLMPARDVTRGNLRVHH